MNNNIIYNNAYGILGLLPNASQKELARRVKEIEKYIQIGETPKFNYDFGLYNIRRTLQDVHDAFFNISNVNTQIIHHFFRIYANDGQQFDILNQIENNFTYAQIKNIYDSINSNNLIVDRNTAILLSLLLIKGSEDNIIVISKMCIDLWFSILNSKKYKSDYKKIFLLDDELGINENIFDSIEEKIIEELSILFSDISQKYENNQILSMFIEKFKLSNDIYNINVVENIYSDIQKNIDIMDSMNISEDGGFDTNEKSSLKSCLSAFQDDFNKLIELGLYENEKTIIIRDLVATKIRIQILDLGLLIHSNNQRQEVITTIKNNAYEYLLNNNDYDCDMELEKLSEYGIDFDTAKNELLDKYEKDKQDIISNIASDYENNKTKFYELKKQYLPIFFDNNEKVFNDAIEQKLGYKELSLKPQPLPKSGVIHNYTGKPAIAPFKIITQDNDENYYIKLVNPYTDKTEIVIFLSGGETKEMNIPIGTYKIKRAAGKTWYGEKYLFGHNSTYVASDELLTFNISGSYVEGHTLTLYKVADGNFSSKEISAEEF